MRLKESHQEGCDFLLHGYQKETKEDSGTKSLSEGRGKEADTGRLRI